MSNSLQSGEVAALAFGLLAEIGAHGGAERADALLDMAGEDVAVAALGVEQIGAGHQIDALIALAAHFQRRLGLRFGGEHCAVDILAPFAGMGEEDDFAVAQTVGGEDLALFSRGGGHDTALRTWRPVSSRAGKGRMSAEVVAGLRPT